MPLQMEQKIISVFHITATKLNHEKEKYAKIQLTQQTHIIHRMNWATQCKAKPKTSKNPITNHKQSNEIKQIPRENMLLKERGRD